jgi:hypothetical protein
LGAKNAFAAGSQTLEITITDAIKEMVTHNSINDARCYFWVYKMALVDNSGNRTNIPVDCPGPAIYAVKGDSITITVINTLDEPHSFFIPGIFNSGPINPGDTFGPQTFTVNKSGAHLYYDNLNEPVNRVMGLHGALVVRPDKAASGHNFTPYDNPTPHVQNLYDSFGTSTFPGLKWEEGDTDLSLPNPTPPFRQYAHVYHQASPNLFAEVGNYPPGEVYPAAQFMQKFLRDPFSPTRANGKPQYFTINGQSGFFSHFSPAVTPINRVGEPVVMHILNAGLHTHSMHFHCNHIFVTSINGEVNPNPIWVDVYGIRPMDRIDYTFPFMRPPDNANERGIGRPDQPIKTITGKFGWPPQDEMQTFFPPHEVPPIGTIGAPTDANGVPLNMGQRLSPLCYPAHDHLETSQTSQGGNYNCGLITGAYVFGDRNAQGQGLGNFRDFPMDPDFAMMFRNIRGLAINGSEGTREAAGPRPT